jgi:hypothetical protein
MFGPTQKMIDARSTAEFFRSARRADVLALSECFFYLGAGRPTTPVERNKNIIKALHYIFRQEYKLGHCQIYAMVQKPDAGT